VKWCDTVHLNTSNEASITPFLERYYDIMIRFAKSSFALMPVVALVVALGACSSSSSGPAATVPADTDLQVLAVSGLKFDKTTYEAVAGDIAIAYVNEDSIRHTLVVVQEDTIVSGFELKVNQNGDIDSGSVTLAAGNYVLFCTVPGHQNMKADLTVK
jgi:plastocyanin